MKRSPREVPSAFRPTLLSLEPFRSRNSLTHVWLPCPGITDGWAGCYDSRFCWFLAHRLHRSESAEPSIVSHCGQTGKPQRAPNRSSSHLCWWESVLRRGCPGSAARQSLKKVGLPETAAAECVGSVVSPAGWQWEALQPPPARARGTHGNARLPRARARRRRPRVSADELH